ncbi:MAG: Na(+)-translocating NADH-quinone reductase subunit A [Bacteroidales bacterium]|nr:Na(+)-translocating NADH-quinone reductase subunit A [Bacteroidales bacterium]
MDNLNVIRIKKGRDIPIPGTAQQNITELFPEVCEYAVKPTDYVGVAPRLLVAEGDNVLAGTPLFEDKNNEGVPFVSPVSGTVKAIVRGEKRALLAVVVGTENGERKTESATHPALTGTPLQEGRVTESDVRETMIKSGLWNLLRQRPFGIVPRKDSQPKAIFISAFDSSPLPVDLDYALKGREEDLQQGVKVLATIAPVHLSLNAKSQRNSFMTKIANAEIHFFEGPHPAGLVGTQIAKISPINKCESVWTVNVQDVATIGHLFRTGEYRPERVVAVCGPCVEEPQYYRIIEGMKAETLLHFPQASRLRTICGDVLSGTSISTDGYLSASYDKISVIPEGDYYDFMGWLRPNFRKFSFSRTFLSGFFKRRTENGERRTLNFTFDTGRHGSVRPLFVTGEFEKLVPLDIYPMQLIKACIVGDIELMENLGIYEVEPEDLALCEFADTSKTEIQAIIRNGLEKIRKEVI